MQFTQSISYPGAVDEVVAMYLTPAYLERRFGQFVVEGSQVVSVEGERVSFAGTVRPELIPACRRRVAALMVQIPRLGMSLCALLVSVFLVIVGAPSFFC